MVLDLFTIPVFIGNIDIKKINLKNQKYKKMWLSDTKTSYDQSFKNVSDMDKDSLKYLMESIIGYLDRL